MQTQPFSRIMILDFRFRVRLFAVTLFFALSCPACDVINPTADEHRLPIESTVEIRLSETLAETRSLVLQAETKRIYGCFNYRIERLVRQIGDDIWILFGRVAVPEGCLTALGPARTTMKPGPLKEGAYGLVLRVNGTEQHAQLIVTADSYEVRDGNGPWTHFPTPHLLRVPEGVIWGTIGYHRAESEPLAQTFLDSLAAIGGAPATLPPGEYGYFRVAPDTVVTTGGEIGYYFARSFAWRFQGDPSMLRELVKRYGNVYPETLSIRVFTWRGDAFYGWVLAHEA